MGPYAARTIQIAIGSKGGGFEDARFVPMPPGAQLEAGAQDLMDWISAPSVDRDPVVATTMAHYQFETLDPFNGGNGRIERLLIVLQLLQDGALANSDLSVSPWFEARRERYQDELANVSRTGLWDPRIRFFAEGIEASAVDTARRIERVLDVQDDYQRRLLEVNIRGITLDIAEFVVGAPSFDIPTLRTFTGKSYQAASDAVTKLVDLHILEDLQIEGGNRRIFRATEVVQAFSQ